MEAVKIIEDMDVLEAIAVMEAMAMVDMSEEEVAKATENTTSLQAWYFLANASGIDANLRAAAATDIMDGMKPAYVVADIIHAKRR